jgi:hypothetical protein
MDVSTCVPLVSSRIYHAHEVTMYFFVLSGLCEELGVCVPAAAYVAERLERLLTLGYVSVVPQVMTVEPQDVSVRQPSASGVVIDNGMYATHDEQVWRTMFFRGQALRAKCVFCMLCFMVALAVVLSWSPAGHFSCPAIQLRLGF